MRRWTLALVTLLACNDRPADTEPPPPPPPAAPEIAGRWEVTDDMNKNAFVMARDGVIVFSTRSRDLGDFVGTFENDQVSAPDAGLTAELSEDGTTLTWSNGMTWRRIDTTEERGRPWTR